MTMSFGGADGEGDGEEKEKEEEEGAPTRTFVRKRRKAPALFHTPASSPPPKLSSSKEVSSSTSVSPGPSSGFLSLEAADVAKENEFKSAPHFFAFYKAMPTLPFQRVT